MNRHPVADENTQEPAHQVRDEEHSGECGSMILAKSYAAVHSIGEHKTTKHSLSTNIEDVEQESKKQQNSAVSDPTVGARSGWQ